MTSISNVTRTETPTRPYPQNHTFTKTSPQLNLKMMEHCRAQQGHSFFALPERPQSSLFVTIIHSPHRPPTEPNPTRNSSPIITQPQPSSQPFATPNRFHNLQNMPPSEGTVPGLRCTHTATSSHRRESTPSHGLNRQMKFPEYVNIKILPTEILISVILNQSEWGSPFSEMYLLLPFFELLSLLPFSSYCRCCFLSSCCRHCLFSSFCWCCIFSLHFATFCFKIKIRPRRSKVLISRVLVHSEPVAISELFPHSHNSHFLCIVPLKWMYFNLADGLTARFI